jgi:hypothetical protein
VWTVRDGLRPGRADGRGGRVELVREAATLSFGEHLLHVQTAPFGCALSDATESEPLWQMMAVRIRPEGKAWQRVVQARLGVVEGARLVLQLTAEDGSPLTLEMALAGDQLAVHLWADVENVAWLAVDLNARPDEHYLGQGERFDSLDQRGKQVDLWVEDGAQGGLSYIPVPFYLSSAGYGLHINTDVRCVARLATPDDPDVVSIRNAAPSLDLTVLPGRTPKEILSRYTAIAGRPEVPPAWVFGPWKSRDWQTADQAGIVEDVEQQHELGLPATVKLIDARWEAAYHTFEFDPVKFPDPLAMIDYIHAHGSRLVLWISPWLAVDNGDDPNDAYDACAERGYFIRRPDGEVYVHRLGNNPLLIGSCLDLTNPEAAAWWQANIRRLVEMGVSGFNTDFGEQVPEDAVFCDGRIGREMHNIYPRLYNELTYEAMQTTHLGARQPGMLLARSGWRPGLRFFLQQWSAHGHRRRVERRAVGFSLLEQRHRRLLWCAHGRSVHALGAVRRVLPDHDGPRRRSPRAVDFFSADPRRLPALCPAAHRPVSLPFRLRPRGGADWYPDHAGHASGIS